MTKQVSRQLGQPGAWRLARRYFAQPRAGGIPSGWACGLFAAFLILPQSACDRAQESAKPTSGMTTKPVRSETRIPAMLRDVATERGVNFLHVAGREGTHFLPESMLGGGALLDYDQDGDLDVYLVSGNYAFDGQEGPGPHSVANRLFRQEADGRFVDVTEQAGVGDTGYGMGAAVGDANNDGFPELYVTNYGPDVLYLNQGDGTFRDITVAAGIDNPLWGSSACFFDYDLDGWLDLYVANYVDYIPSHGCLGYQNQPDYCPPATFRGSPDKLYHNISGKQPAGTRQVVFEDVSDAAGITRKRKPGDGLATTDQRAAAAAGAFSAGAGLGLAVDDINADGWPDIFVANDFGANYLWINEKDGTFTDDAVPLGCAFDSAGRAQANMGVAVDDIDGNGTQDFFVTHLVREINALFLNEPGVGYSETADARGLGNPSYELTGFGTVFADLEHDGDLDLLVVNGRVMLPINPPDFSHLRRVTGMNDYWTTFAEPKQIYLNDGAGNFVSVTSDEDDFLSTLSMSRGLCMGDVDNDGDVDFLVTNTAAQAELFLNVAEKKGNWLSVRAIEPAYGGRDAYHAAITLKSAAATRSRHVRVCSSYCSSHDPRVHFGLGPTNQIDAIEVRWPNGDRETFPGCAVNQFVTVKHGEGVRL